MSIETAIHEIWAAEESLAALVPPQRVTTGPAHGPTASPYVVLERGPDQPVALCSDDARLERIRIALHVWASNLDQAQAISAAARGALDRLSFEFDGGLVLDTRPVGREQHIHGDGAAQVIMQYDMLTQLIVAEA